MFVRRRTKIDSRFQTHSRIHSFSIMQNYILTIILLLSLHLQAQNPILPIGTYIADPSVKVWDDGRLYIYGSRDESTQYYCSYDYYVVSTDDMKEWTIVKDAFHSRGEKDQVPYTDKQLFAPDCHYFDGKYYLYYCHPGPGTREGVAVSDSPNGPFKNVEAIDTKGHNQIDPCVFVDDNGQAYYLWGQFNLKMAKLNEDRKSIDETSLHDSVLTEPEHYFHEGAFLTKRNGIYYLIYADISRGGRPTCLGYATATSVFGPYEYQGVIIDNSFSDPKTWNNHGSIAEFNEQWYVFYHRPSHNSVMMRRTCVEPIYFNEDGTIDEVEMTSQGAGLPLNAFDDIEIERACLLHGDAYFELFENGNEQLTNISRHDVAAFKYIDFGDSEAKKVEVKVAPGTAPGRIILAVDQKWHQGIAEVKVPACKGDEEWLTITADVAKVIGERALWLVFYGTDGEMYKVDRFRFLK